MFRRIMLAMTFIAALGVVGLATPNTAEAWRWGRGYGGYSVYYGPRPYYGYGVPYRTYYSYPSGVYYGPQAYYGPSYYRPYYGYYGTPDYYYRPAPRVALRIGF